MRFRGAAGRTFLHREKRALQAMLLFRFHRKEKPVTEEMAYAGN